MLDARRGTVLWAINHFRKEALHAFVADLHALEDRGLSEKECKRVQDALASVIEVAAAVPAGSYWEQSVYEALERFQEVYVMWNTHPQEASHGRRADLAKLRRRKKAISTRIADHQHVLVGLLKVGLVVQMYEALAQIAADMPQLFPKLAKAVERFRKGIS